MTVYLLLVVVVLLVLAWFRTRRERLPPGPWGLPVVGYLPFLNPSHPYTTLTKLTETWGKVFTLRMGSVDCVVLADNKITKELFSQEAVSGRPPLFLFSEILEQSGIIFSQAEVWREQRRFAGLAMRRQGIEKWLGQTMQEMMELFTGQAGTAMDPQEILSHVVGNMMNQAIFCKRYSRDDPQWRLLQRISKDGAKRLGDLSPVNFLPFLRYLPSFRKDFQFIKESQEAQFEMYERITQEREAHLAEGGEPECLTDFYLQQVQERGSQPGSFTRRQLYFFQGDMFGAGTETSVNTILFALMILSSHRYRDLQEDIRQEILTELGSAPPSLSHCLPLLRATILEVQRLRPVTPQGIPHGVLSPVLAGDWVLPPGTMVMPLHWAVNRDPAIWSLPDTFHPQRFLQEDGLRGNILPFQVGKRRCLGEDLGRSLIFLTLANIFQRFSVSLEPEIDVWDDPVNGFTLSPKPFKVILALRH